jgi:hypothetical protein
MSGRNNKMKSDGDGRATRRNTKAVTTEQRATKLMYGLRQIAREQPDLDISMTPGSQEQQFFDLLNTEPYGRGPAAAKRYFTPRLPDLPFWKLCYLRGILKAHKKVPEHWPELESQWDAVRAGTSACRNK